LDAVDIAEPEAEELDELEYRKNDLNKNKKPKYAARVAFNKDVNFLIKALMFPNSIESRVST
jgi:hypothetical protein